jgi:hypothetical protein
MKCATVTVFKFFWPDQDVEQEQWLRQMSLKGLHLEKLNLLQLWTFVKGEPADMVYRVDFNSASERADYRQLLEDAGWERAACLTGWQYWRTRAVNGRLPEIFTDAKSKEAKFKRLMTLIGLCSLPSVFLFASPSMRHALSAMSMPFLVVIVGAFLLNVAGLVRLIARVFRMRREQS